MIFRDIGNCFLLLDKLYSPLLLDNNDYYCIFMYNSVKICHFSDFFRLPVKGYYLTFDIPLFRHGARPPTSPTVHATGTRKAKRLAIKWHTKH